MPALARAGLILLACGFLADVAYHALPIELSPFFGSDGVRAHLVVFVGMLVVVVGLVAQGVSAAHIQSVSERRDRIHAIR